MRNPFPSIWKVKYSVQTYIIKWITLIEIHEDLHTYNNQWHAKVHLCTAWWYLPLNNNINGHQSVKGEDLHEKQPHNQDNHCVCPHINAWEQTMQTSIRYPRVSIYWFFFFSFLSNNKLPLIFSSSWHSLSWWSEKIKCEIPAPNLQIWSHGLIFTWWGDAASPLAFWVSLATYWATVWWPVSGCHSDNSHHIGDIVLPG